MGFLRTVDVFPPTGFVDQPWRDDADEDAFVRSSRRVCERYSEALRDVVRPLPDRFSRLVILTARHDADHVEVEVDTTSPSAVAEWATATLPDGVRSLRSADRALLALEVIDLAMRTLAGVRGWDGEAVGEARRHVEEHRLGYSRLAAWKASPSRALQARTRSDLADDGFARIWVDVAERGSGRPVLSAGPFRGFCTREGLVRAERTLRWNGSGEVRLAPMVGLFGDTGHTVTVDVAGDSTSEPDVWPDDALTRPAHGTVGPTPRPAVLLQGPGPDDDVAPHEIRVGGGGGRRAPRTAWRSTCGRTVRAAGSRCAAVAPTRGPASTVPRFRWARATRPCGSRGRTRRHSSTRYAGGSGSASPRLCVRGPSWGSTEGWSTARSRPSRTCDELRRRRTARGRPRRGRGTRGCGPRRCP